MQLAVTVFFSLLIFGNAFAENLPTNPVAAESPSVQQELSITLPAEISDEIAREDSPADQIMIQPASAAAVVSAKTTKEIKETEIPVNLEDTKKAASGSGLIAKAIYLLGGMLIIGGGLVFVVRKYAKNAGKSNEATRIKVLTQHYLGPKKSLAIIRVAGESILIGVTDNNITLIKSLSLLDEDIPEELSGSFEKVMTKENNRENSRENFGNQTHLSKNAKSKASFHRKSEELELDSEEEFAISGIKDVVRTKLKSMKVI